MELRAQEIPAAKRDCSVAMQTEEATRPSIRMSLHGDGESCANLFESTRNGCESVVRVAVRLQEKIEQPQC